MTSLELSPLSERTDGQTPTDVPLPLHSNQIPINHPMDISAAVQFASRGNVLELPDLRDVAKTLSVLQTLKGAYIHSKPSQVEQSRDEPDRLTDHASAFPPCPGQWLTIKSMHYMLMCRVCGAAARGRDAPAGGVRRGDRPARRAGGPADGRLRRGRVRCVA